MWLLPEQLGAILDEHGVPRDPSAREGGALHLGVAVEPSAGAVRLEARAGGGAAAAVAESPWDLAQLVASALAEATGRRSGWRTA
jgi:hypothetical protein